MCTSNHDAVQSTFDRYTAGILPINSVDSTSHFYHFQKGNVHVVACDGYFTSTSVMNDWLDRELAKIPKEDWLIGFWHNPCYGDMTYKDSYLRTCSAWLKKFYEHGGDFIIHGHAHTFVRSKPLLPNGSVDYRDGMVHIVNGCGGADFKRPQAITEKIAYTPPGWSFACVTFITLEGNTARVETIDVRKLTNIGIFDSWTWDKTTGVMRRDVHFVEGYSLNPCYPNPFNPATTISYTLGQPGPVQLQIFDVTGKCITTLVDEYQSAGLHTLQWDAMDVDGEILPSGMYLCRIRSVSFVQTKKMLFLK